MANNENLKLIRTSEEAKRKGKNGGIASGKKRAKKKELKETLEILLTMPNAETGESNQTSIAIALMQQALAGNVKAFETIRDTIGQKPVNKEEIKTDVPPTIYINRQMVHADGTIEDDDLPL